MSEHEPGEHSSFIKTPKQLLVVIVLSFVVPVLLIAMLAGIAARSVAPSAVVLSEDAIAKRLKPVGQVVIAEGSDTPGQRAGKQIAESVCAACHVTGALNAPKIGDTAAWAKLIPQGLAHLTETAIKGIRQMPARGGSPDLTDIEVTRAVAYMANQSGANFKEPAIKPDAAAQVAAAPGAAPTGAPPAAASPTAAAPPATVAPAASPGATPKPAAAGAQASGGGKGTYDAACTICHAAGIAGAPKTGDKAAWAPRVQQGAETLYQSAIKGKGAMPAKGGNVSLSDADVKAAVDYMVGLVK